MIKQEKCNVISVNIIILGAVHYLWAGPETSRGPLIFGKSPMGDHLLLAQIFLSPRISAPLPIKMNNEQSLTTEKSFSTYFFLRFFLIFFGTIFLACLAVFPAFFKAHLISCFFLGLVASSDSGEISIASSSCI